MRVAATGRESGVSVEMPVAHEFTIRDDLVVRFKVYGSREQALEAVGLSGVDDVAGDRPLPVVLSSVACLFLGASEAS